MTKINVGKLRTLIRESIAQSMLDKAVALATDLHKDQRDKGGAAYIDHPLRVMKNILSKGYAADVAIAAVLHDTVEDTILTINDIRREFGERVSTTVSLLSKLPGESYDVFIDRIVASGNKAAMQVKLADLDDNSNVARLGHAPDDKELQRLDKYQKAVQKIASALK